MTVKPAEPGRAVIGISGHAGAGHVHSHSGFIQEDSVGFAVAASLILQAYPADTRVAAVAAESDVVTVETNGGGVGTATARRGFSPYEIELMQRSIGVDSVMSQSVAFRCFGRIYGQGILEAPVAFQTALCLAAIDTVAKTHAEHVLVEAEGIRMNVGAGVGACIDINGTSVAVLAVLNATAGGIGPIEDLEGNIALAGKGVLMKKLGMEKLPTLIIENKGYIPAISKDLTQDTFFVRYNKDYDNPAVGKALKSSCNRNGFPVMSSDTAYPRDKYEMKNATASFAHRVMDVGRRLEQAETSHDKTNLIAELALLASQDAGGINYMSEKLHGVVAAGGLVPGTAAVLSLVVTQSYIEKNIIPEIDSKDIDRYIDVVVSAVEILSAHIDEAHAYLERFSYFDEKHLAAHI